MSAHRILGLLVGPKGWAVRPLKRYARRWVQNVVRQFGPIRRGRRISELSLVREDRMDGPLVDRLACQKAMAEWPSRKG